MLQQTQVATVIPYYRKFLEKWPTLQDLAAADESEVLKVWEGLGYYSRARHLLAAARRVAADYGGQLPSDEKALLSLPGIGEYTAGAIRSLAFSQPAAAVDGKVVRVFARLTATAWQPGDPAQRRQVRQLVEPLIPENRPGDFNEALMDLGATICLPQNPNCTVCPLTRHCQAFLQDEVSRFPERKAVRDRPVENKICLIFTSGRTVHVNRRPPGGMLAGLYEFDWQEPQIPAPSTTPDMPGQDLGTRRQVFSHRIWQVRGWRIEQPASDTADARALALLQTGSFVSPEELVRLPFPKVLTAWRDQLAEELAVRHPAAAAAGIPGAGGPVVDNSPV